MRCLARSRVYCASVECAGIDGTYGHDAVDHNAIYNHAVDNNAGNHTADNAFDNDADTADVKSVHAGPWHDDERSADAGYIQPDFADRSAERDDHQSGDDAAILDMPVDRERHDEFELRAGDPADNAALSQKGQKGTTNEAEISRPLWRKRRVLELWRNISLCRSCVRRSVYAESDTARTRADAATEFAGIR